MLFSPISRAYARHRAIVRLLEDFRKTNSESINGATLHDQLLRYAPRGLYRKFDGVFYEAFGFIYELATDEYVVHCQCHDEASRGQRKLLSLVGQDGWFTPVEIEEEVAYTGCRFSLIEPYTFRTTPDGICKDWDLFPMCLRQMSIPTDVRQMTYSLYPEQMN
jgi:hypothetical protein